MNNAFSLRNGLNIHIKPHQLVFHELNINVLNKSPMHFISESNLYKISSLMKFQYH